MDPALPESRELPVEIILEKAFPFFDLPYAGTYTEPMVPISGISNHSLKVRGWV